MRTLVGAVTVAGMLLLTGCGGGDPIPTLPPTPTATPIFASEEEALAAAEEAYAAYLEMSNLISSEGGVDPERIAPFASRDFYQSALEGFETLRGNQWRTIGASVLEGAVLQFADTTGQNQRDVVAAYVCVDVAGVDVVDANGASVVSPDRPDLQAFEVFFDINSEGLLVPSSRETWEPGAVCGVS
jgi:hypothetical protein